MHIYVLLEKCNFLDRRVFKEKKEKIKSKFGVLYIYIFIIIFLKMVFHHVGQAGLEILSSSDSPISVSPSSGITGMSHCDQLSFKFLFTL